MTQQEFNELSKRYLEGKTNKEEEAAILAWFEAQPEFKIQSPADEATQKIGERIWRNLYQKARAARSGRLLRLAGGMSIAASILLACFFIFHWSKTTLNPVPSTALVPKAKRGLELKNDTDTAQKITLEDGSIVILQPGSSLLYAKEFNRAKRELHLNGEAFFEVTKNPEKPFIVHSGELVAEVLGTSFTIKKVQNSQDLIVDVLTGRVSVYAQKAIGKTKALDPQKQGVVLTPNQRVQFFKAEKRLVKSAVETPNVLIPKEELAKMTFVDAPIEQVFGAIEKAYGLEVVYDEALMRHCTLTTSLDEENLYDKLSIICKLLNASYQMIDAQIIVTSDGCEE